MKQLLYIGNCLEKHGFTPTSADILPSLFRKESYSVKVASDKKNKGLRFLDMFCHVLQQAGKKNLFVLIDTYSTQNFLYAYSVGQICRILNLPYILILRGGNLEKRLQSKNNRTLFSNAYKNVVPSLFLQSKFNKYVTNLTYIPNSIPLQYYSFKTRKVFSPYLLWVRTFKEFYNPMLAIRVLEKLKIEYPNARLVMVGPEKDDSLAICKEYVADKKLPVRFTGKLTKAQWHKLAEEYDIFINTTTIDNTPISVIEAMALGLPVVSSEVGGIPFLIENGKDGLLFENKNCEACVAQVKYILEDPKKGQQLAQKAREKVSYFDWEVVKHAWHKILA